MAPAAPSAPAGGAGPHFAPQSHFARAAAVAALAVVSPAGAPLLAETPGEAPGSAAALALHRALYAALDVVEERLEALGAAGGKEKDKDCYLGELLPLEDGAVHGYVTPTWATLLLVLRDGAVAGNGSEGGVQGDARRRLRALHGAYAKAMAAPLGGGHSGAGWAPGGWRAVMARRAVGAPER